MTYNEELRLKRAKLVEDWRAILAVAEGEKRALKAEERTSVEAIEKDLDAVSATIEAREKADALDRAVVPESQRVVEQAAGKGTPAERATTAFWQAMRNGQANPEYRADLKVGTDSAGGFLVPDVFRREMVQALIEENIIRGLATSFETSSGTMTSLRLSTL
jgi:HK97 family phage major capsid protein